MSRRTTTANTAPKWDFSHLAPNASQGARNGSSAFGRPMSQAEIDASWDQAHEANVRAGLCRGPLDVTNAPRRP